MDWEHANCELGTLGTERGIAALKDGLGPVQGVRGEGNGRRNL
jgi:hypothetical protein